MTSRIILVLLLFSLFYGCSDKSDIKIAEEKPAEQEQSQEKIAPAVKDKENQPPVISSLKLLPAVPLKGDKIIAEVSAEDVDGDKVFYEYEWRLNNDSLPDVKGDTLDMDLNKGDIIQVRVTPYDASTRGSFVVSMTGIGNSSPKIETELADVSIKNKKCEAKVAASDPDGDALTYSLKRAPDGMTIDSESGIVTWGYKADKSAKKELTVSVKDTDGAETELKLSVGGCFIEEKRK